VVSPCVRTFQGLHSVRLWTPTILLQVIASGLLLSDGNGLKDPCEREDSDVSSLLMTIQEREDITRGSQRFLRLMHFRQIYKVLGMPMEDGDDACKELLEANGKELTVVSVEEN
jgi:hypothetical protein